MIITKSSLSRLRLLIGFPTPLQVRDSLGFKVLLFLSSLFDEASQEIFQMKLITFPSVEIPKNYIERLFYLCPSYCHLMKIVNGTNPVENKNLQKNPLSKL